MPDEEKMLVLKGGQTGKPKESYKPFPRRPQPPTQPQPKQEPKS